MKNKKLVDLIEKLQGQRQHIPDIRKKELESLADLINSKLAESGDCSIVVICTHNSRRSQLGEIWINLAAEYFNIRGIHAFSGGTEGTAFNYRMVYAVQKKGVDIYRISEGSNPRYLLNLKTPHENRTLHSKRYDEEPNPSENFIALMVCDEADQNCPVVLGASHRISMPYEDPKIFDDTAEELDRYLEKVDEIGREILYCLSRVSHITQS